MLTSGRMPALFRLQRGREDLLCCLGKILFVNGKGAAGPSFAVADGAQLSAERLLGDRDAELLEDPLRLISAVSAPRGAQAGRSRSPGDRLALSLSLEGRARRLAVQETVRPCALNRKNSHG
jgi:hypothetical protein